MRDADFVGLMTEKIRFQILLQFCLEIVDLFKLAPAIPSGTEGATFTPLSGDFK